MKKHLPVIITLVLGIALGGGCMFLVLAYLSPTDVPGDGDPQREGGGDLSAEVNGFAVTAGAAPGYIEDQACAACHQELFNAYRQVGMAQSFSRPTAENAIEDFQNSHFVHEASQRHYEMKRQGDGIVFRRYQLDAAGEPINEFQRQVDWILGSGKHARNYLYQTEAGEMYQLPVAWYPQEGRWGMAARFDLPNHDGVHHQIQRDCLFCHNAYPDVPAGSDAYSISAKFPHKLPQGIGCQRCHGPGAEHVQVASSETASLEKKRRSIVNPARLSPQLREDVCNQCHYQPTSAIAGIRQFGRGDYSFRPGEPLADYLFEVDVVEQGRNLDERFEINHHAYRLRQSRCFLESDEKLSCLTCHDAHHTVPAERRAQHYAAACAQCHQPDQCTLGPERDQHLQGVDAQDCATCHMSKRRAEDVVHVVMTDHMIRKKPLDGSQLAARDEMQRQLTDVVLALPDAKPGDDRYEMIRAVTMLRLSRFSLAEPAIQLENALAALEPPAVEPYLDLTQAQLSQRRFAAARQTAAQVLQRSPSHPLAIEWQGTALMSLRKGDAAIERLNKALSLSPDRAETHYNLGIYLLGEDKFEEGLERITRALELRPNLYLAAYYQGLAYEKLKRPEDAVRAYEKALQIEPTFARAYVNLGQLLLAQNRRDEARRYLRVGLQVVSDPKTLLGLFQEAEYAEVTPILSESVEGNEIPPLSPVLVAVPIPVLDRLEPTVAQQIQEFLGAFERLAQANSKSAAQIAEGYGMLGQLYHAYEFSNAAERCYVNAIRLTQDKRYYHLLGALYQQVGQLEAAAAYFTAVLKLQPDDAAAATRLGTVTLQLNQPGKARAHFRQALEADPDSPAAHFGMGEAALAEEKYAEAVTHFENVLRLVPGANRVHYSLGMAYRGLGETEKAQAELAKRGTVGVRPADPLVDALPQLLQGENVYLIRGQLAFSAGRYTEAGEAYAKALEANPDSVSALTNYGAALSKQGQQEEAAVHLRRAIELDPNSTVANYNLASVLTSLGEFEEALKLYDVVLEASPEDVVVLRMRADVLRKLGKADEAIASLEKLLTDNPTDEATLIDLSDLLVERKDYQRSIKLLSEANEQFPERGLTNRTLANLLATCPDLSLRNGERAVELATAVVTAQKTPQHLQTLAFSLAEAGRCEEAALIQQQLVDLAKKLEKEELAAQLEEDLVRYQAGSPCRPVGRNLALDLSAPNPEPQPDGTEPGETNSDDPRPDGTEPAAAKPEDAKPAAAKPDDEEPGDNKPANVKPGDNKPSVSDAKPTSDDAKPGAASSAAGNRPEAN